MSLQHFKQLMSNGKLACPECGKPIRSFEKFVEKTVSVWDGAGDSEREEGGSVVTLVCGNEGCAWRERTEFWSSYEI